MFESCLSILFAINCLTATQVYVSLVCQLYNYGVGALKSVLLSQLLVKLLFYCCVCFVFVVKVVWLFNTVLLGPQLLVVNTAKY